MKKKDIIFLSSLLLFSLFAFWRWFFTFGILSSGDWGFLYQFAGRELFTLPSMWNNFGYGSVDYGLSLYPVNLLWGILSYMANFPYVERFLYMWPTVLVGIIGMYSLAKKNLHSSIGALTAVFVFNFNSYMLLIRTGQLTLAMAYSLSTVAILVYQISIEKRKLFNTVFAGLILAILSFYEFRIFYIVFFLSVFYAVFFLIFIQNNFSKKNIVGTSFYSLLPFIIVFLLNNYWILSFKTIETYALQTILSRGLFGNEFLNILYSLTLFHPFWSGDFPTIFKIVPIPFYVWLIPLFAFGGLYLGRRKPTILYWGFIALLGVILTKQAGEPFTSLYLFLFSHFPGFSAFREASKFYFITGLGYSMLIGYFISELFKACKSKSWYIPYFAIFAILSIFIFNSKPLVNGEVRTLFISRVIPLDYQKFKDEVISQKSYSRTLWVPIISRWGIYTNNHPALISLDELSSTWLDLTSKTLWSDKNKDGERIDYFLQQQFIPNLLSMSSVRYVIIPIEDRQNEDDFFSNYGISRNQYINTLNSLPELRKLPQYKDLVVYQVNNSKPNIYVTFVPESLKVYVSYKEVKIFDKNPYSSEITLSDVNNPVYLQYTESYHPDWKLYPPKTSWISILFGAKSLDAIHAMNPAGLNTFYLDPRKLCLQTECTKNLDGSDTISLELFFKPQVYTFLGGIISLLTLIALVTLIIFSLFKNIHER